MIKPTRNKIRICWEKYINNLYHKELRSITHKELLQISKEKTTNPTEKLVQEINRQLTEKEIQSSKTHEKIYYIPYKGTAY